MLKIRFLFFLFFVLFILSCREKIVFSVEKEKHLLNDFLIPSVQTHSKKQIENSIYDLINKQGRYRGRAIYIGDFYFLTANHVLSKSNEKLFLILQKNRTEISQKKKFKVLEVNEFSDLALLHIPIDISHKKQTGIARFHLNDIPKIGDIVSEFFYLSKRKNHKPYYLEFSGLNYYENWKTVSKLGRFIVEANSDLLEKQGSVWNIKKDFFTLDNMSTGLAGIKKEIMSFASIPTFGGESGSGVFQKVSDDQYKFVGITLISWATNYDIPTPNHPQGWNTIQQTGNFFANKKPVKSLIQSYLKREY